MLSLYRTALAERRPHPALGDGSLSWDEGTPPDVLSFTREPGFRCVVNFGPEPYPLPEGSGVLVTSGDPTSRVLETDETAWLQTT